MREQLVQVVMDSMYGLSTPTMVNRILDTIEPLIRADEREKIDNALYYRIEDCEQMVADARANERVLIAQAIEAEAERTLGGRPRHSTARTALREAAQIARNGGRDEG